MTTPFPRKKILLLGSGELGKEVTIEAMRLGQHVIACDRYPSAPAMHVAEKSYVFPMLDGNEIRRVVELEKPDLIVPEIEAIATPTLAELEKEGWRVIPTARAVRLTMDREGIRRLAAEESDTTAKGGGLMSRVASKAIGRLPRLMVVSG